MNDLTNFNQISPFEKNINILNDQILTKTDKNNIPPESEINKSGKIKKKIEDIDLLSKNINTQLQNDVASTVFKSHIFAKISKEEGTAFFISPDFYSDSEEYYSAISSDSDDYHSLSDSGEYYSASSSDSDDYYPAISLDKVISPDVEREESEILSLGDLQLHKINPMSLQSGDIICTYESINTQPTVILATFAQLLTSTGRKENLHKMLHFEVVLSVSETGIARVAHASGLVKHIITENQNLKDFAPGTAIVVMRPKSAELKEEIVRVASTTADKGNPWGIKGITRKNMVLTQVKSFKKSKEKKLQKTIRMAVDSYDKFFNKDATKLKTMSCAQFASNVINSSLLRLNPLIQPIFSDPDLARNEKIERILTILKTENREKIYQACGLFHNDVTSSSLTDSILSQPNEWEIPGYIGISADIPVKKLELSQGRLLASDLAMLDLGSPDGILSLFKSLMLINPDGYLKGSDNEKKIKLMIAFSYLYSKQHQLDPTTLAKKISEKSHTLNLEGDPHQVLYDGAWAKFNEFYEAIKTLEDLPKSPKIKDILAPSKVYISVDRLKSIKNEILKQNSFPDIESSKIQTLFSLESAGNTIKKVSNYAKLFFNIGGVVVMASYSPVIGMALALSGKVFSDMSNEKISDFLTNWELKIEKAYRLAKPTHVISLKSDVGIGYRPWIVYSEDEEKTWHVEPLQLKLHSNDQWEIQLHISKDLTYKFFKGTWDENAFNPYEGAKWQRTSNQQNLYLSIKEINEAPINDNRLGQLPDCLNVSWES